MSKAKTRKTLQRHASRRATSRFEFDFNSRVYEDACLSIRKQQDVGECRLVQHLETQSNAKTLWLLEIRGEMVLAAYDKKRAAISTFMPPSYREDLMLI